MRSGEIDIDAPVALVRAPVEAGLSKFIDVANIPKLDDLPFIPERMRDFSFRYATEYLPVKQSGMRVSVRILRFAGTSNVCTIWHSM